jgi:hypothetical protein
MPNGKKRKVEASNENMGTNADSSSNLSNYYKLLGDCCENLLEQLINLPATFKHWDVVEINVCVWPATKAK